MAHDRYDTRDAPRDERSRWRDDQSEGRGDRGFFERAGDEVASWFGDEEAERRRRDDRLRDQHEGGWGNRERDYGAYGRDWNRDPVSGDRRSRDRDEGRLNDRDRDWYETRGLNERGGFSDRDYNPSWRRELSGPGNRQRSDFRERDYRPMTGDYSRTERESGQFFAASGVGRGERAVGEYDRSRDERSSSPWARDEYRRTSRAGTADQSDRSRHEDPHYESWRQRHMSDLDRDYDEYRRENQSRFESDFGGWRERRMRQRGLLGQIREHMEVVGNDDKHVGTVDKTAGDRLILTKSDPDSGGVHHSLSCSDIDRVEGDRVILDCSSDQAKQRWRDESRNRALFEREDQGEMGPRILDRSFEGTYR
jgi:hypothetical protein